MVMVAGGKFPSAPFQVQAMPPHAPRFLFMRLLGGRWVLIASRRFDVWAIKSHHFALLAERLCCPNGLGPAR